MTPTGFLGSGDHFVETVYVERARICVRDVLDSQAIGLLHGPAGTGKTFTAQAVTTERPEVSVRYLKFQTNPSPRFVAAEIVQEVGLQSVRRGENRYALLDRAEDILGSGTFLIVVDEAQHLSTACIEVFRHLWDLPRTHFSLLLVGGPGTARVLESEPMLSSRIYRSVKFRPLTPAEVLRHVRRLDPLLEPLGDEQLSCYDEVLKGNFRNWAK